jgi:hypothetical protein
MVLLLLPLYWFPRQSPFVQFIKNIVHTGLPFLTRLSYTIGVLRIHPFSKPFHLVLRPVVASCGHESVWGTSRTSSVTTARDIFSGEESGSNPDESGAAHQILEISSGSCSRRCGEDRGAMSGSSKGGGNRGPSQVLSPKVKASGMVKFDLCHIFALACPPSRPSTSPSAERSWRCKNTPYYVCNGFSIFS